MSPKLHVPLATLIGVVCALIVALSSGMLGAWFEVYAYNTIGVAIPAYTVMGIAAVGMFCSFAWMKWQMAKLPPSKPTEVLPKSLVRPPTQRDVTLPSAREMLWHAPLSVIGVAGCIYGLLFWDSGRPVHEYLIILTISGGLYLASTCIGPGRRAWISRMHGEWRNQKWQQTVPATILHAIDASQLLTTPSQQRLATFFGYLPWWRRFWLEVSVPQDGSLIVGYLPVPSGLWQVYRTTHHHPILVKSRRSRLNRLRLELRCVI